MKLLDALADLLLEKPAQKKPAPSEPRRDRLGRRYQTREELEAERAAFRKSLARTDY
jgi:hypothetical protein